LISNLGICTLMDLDIDMVQGLGFLYFHLGLIIGRLWSDSGQKYQN
jgi:hypothetical protein